MHYPIEILPQPHFIVPFPFKELVSLFGDYLLCYRIEGTIKENLEDGEFHGRRKLKKSCFKHVPHMSMNLHGGDFLPSYVKYVQHSPASNDWDGTSLISLDDFLDFVDEKEYATPIFYRASTICQDNIQTLIVVQDKKGYDSIAEAFKDSPLPPYEKGKGIFIPTDIRINHVPTNLNYWHVQMEVYPPMSQKELGDDKASWRKRIFDQIRDSILCYQYYEMPPMEYQIPKGMYVKDAI